MPKRLPKPRQKRPDFVRIMNYQWIGLRENLQEAHI